MTPDEQRDNLADQQPAGSLRVSGLSLEERAQLLAGESHWKTYAAPSAGIRACFSPTVLMACAARGRPGLHGHCGKSPGDVFSHGFCVACSLDPELVERVGAAIGEEARRQCVDVVLGPGVNIKRHPLCGRRLRVFQRGPGCFG